jgi:peptidoglycan/LPS O-acetylase OafA/YrhL
LCGAGFWTARVRRIYPTFWWVAVPLTFLAAATGTLAPEEYWKAPIWWAGASFVSPATFWPVVDSWWYIGLAMQLYLAFTAFLWLAGRRWGVLATAALCAAAPFVYVFALPCAGTAADYLESWFIGLSYVTLFCAGFLLSRLLGTGAARDGASGLLAALALLVVCLVVMAVLRERWVAQPAALAVVLLVVPWASGAADGAAVRVVAWLAGLSFVFYLSHSPWAKPVLGLLDRAGIDAPWAAWAACLAAAFGVALGFWASFRWAETRIAMRRQAR